MQNIPELDAKGLRNFGFMFAGFIAGLFGVFFPWVLEYGFPVWPWAVTGVFLLWALAAPNSMEWFYVLWMKFGMVIGTVINLIILGVVFFLVIFPIGLFFKLRRNDPMARKLDKDTTTYRVTSTARPATQIERPF